MSGRVSGAASPAGSDGSPSSQRGGGSRPSSQRSLRRSDSDLTQRASLGTYELRPQPSAGQTGQVVAKGPQKDGKKAHGKATVSTVKLSPAEALLAAADADIAAAKKSVRNSDPRHAVSILRNAYARAEAAAAGADPEVAMLARGLVRVELAGVYSALSRHREALEEAVGAMLETDAAWQAVLAGAAPGDGRLAGTPSGGGRGWGDERFTHSATRTKETWALAPEEGLRALLENPPLWLDRVAEASVRTRSCVAAKLRSAVDGVKDKLESDGEDLISEAHGLLQEAEMLARHFLPDKHPVRKRAEMALLEWQSAAESRSEDAEAGDSLPLEEAQVENSLCSAGQAPQLPPLSGLPNRRRLPPPKSASVPVISHSADPVNDSASSSRGAAASGGFDGERARAHNETAQGLADDSGVSVCQRSNVQGVAVDDSDVQGVAADGAERAPSPPVGRAPTQLDFRATAPPSSWTGRCAPGDVYYSSLPKTKLPRLSESGKKKSAAPSEQTEAQKKRAEGAAGGMSRATSALVLVPEKGRPNPFKDWLGSFDDPTSHDIKRIIMRSDEAANRHKLEIKRESSRFKIRWLNERSEDELYESRITFCGYGIRATKIAEKRAAVWKKEWGFGETAEASNRRETRKELFNFYGVDLKGSEPNLATLGKLLKESEPRDRSPKKVLSKKEQMAQNMQNMFGGGGGLLGNKKMPSPDPSRQGSKEVDGSVAGSLSRSLSKRASLAP